MSSFQQAGNTQKHAEAYKTWEHSNLDYCFADALSAVSHSS